MKTPFRQALNMLKKMESSNPVFHSLIATKDAALIVLGDCKATQTMPGDIVKMWSDGDVLHVLFALKVADVHIVWRRSFASRFTLPDAFYTRVQ